MNLVIKNSNELADENAPYIYKDARVNKGTLFFIEFSNRGSLSEYDLKRGITDLADDTQVRGNIITDPEIRTVRNNIPELTEKKGMPLVGLGNMDNHLTTTGIRIRGLNNYLYQQQPRSLLIVWLELQVIEGSAAPNRFMRTTTVSEGSLPYNITAIRNSVNTTFSMYLAGKSGFNNENVDENVYTQVAVEFIDSQTPLNLYKNGVLVGTGSVSDGGFIAPDGEDIFAIGGLSPNVSIQTGVVLYEACMHDLDESGLTAGEVLKIDYEYVNGIGQFEGLPTRRPYANIPLA